MQELNILLHCWHWAKILHSFEIGNQFQGDWAGLNSNLSFHAAFDIHFAPISLPCPSQAKLPQYFEKKKKCELVLSVAFTWPESVKVAENKPVLASPWPALSHIICTLENAITVGRLLAYFIYCRVGLWGNVQTFREVGSWNTHHQHWNNVIMTWIIASQGGRRLSGTDWPWGR